MVTLMSDLGQDLDEDYVTTSYATGSFNGLPYNHNVPLWGTGKILERFYSS